MPMIPQFFSASSQEVAEKALQLGYLRYPGICFVTDIRANTRSILWITEKNEMEYIVGNGQITDIRYQDNVLTFYHFDKELYSIPIGLSEDVVDRIVSTIMANLQLDSYAKTTEVIQLLDDKIGDIGSLSVEQYIEAKMQEAPITKLTGTIFQSIDLSALPTGLYKILGQYKVGGKFQTIHTAIGGELFYIEKKEDNSTSVTKCTGADFQKYLIYANGDYLSDKYVTESWIADLDFMPRDSAKEYVETLIDETISEQVDSALSTKLDNALDLKLGAIKEEDINSIF